MDFVTSGAFLGVVAVIVGIFLIATLRKPSVFFTIVATVGVVLFVAVVAVTLMAAFGVDRFNVQGSLPPV